MRRHASFSSRFRKKILGEACCLPIVFVDAQENRVVHIGAGIERTQRSALEARSVEAVRAVEMREAPERMAMHEVCRDARRP